MFVSRCLEIISKVAELFPHEVVESLVCTLLPVLNLFSFLFFYFASLSTFFSSLIVHTSIRCLDRIWTTTFVWPQWYKLMDTAQQ